MTENYFFKFDFNKYSLLDNKNNILFADFFGKKQILFNDIKIEFKTKWFENFILKKRVLIEEKSNHVEIKFKLEKISGIWSFKYRNERFMFHLMKDYKSKLVRNEIIISEIDIKDSNILNFVDWTYRISCEDDNYLHVILICILLFVTVEGVDGLIAPNKNWIGSKK